MAPRLPATATPIVGRDDLTAAVVDLVVDHPVVTLTGVGGVGKTRLAIEVARKLDTHFDDGVWMIELAPVDHADSVPDAIANALGVTPQGGGSVLDAVAEAVAGRRMLLVLDNCEHVQEAAAAAIQRILARSSTAAFLATSRDSLWLAGEQRVSVSPLALDDDVVSPAVQLFVERAIAVRRDFDVSEPADLEAVVEICHRLDGLPLAIELAAARMASMTAVELRDRLEHRFRLLVGADRLPERHRTLERVVAWSYDLLSGDERDLLVAASTFTGGFRLGDLVELVGEDDEIGVLTHLDALVHRSLVVADQRGRTTRYRLLETIRQFAAARLVDGDCSGSATVMRDRHAALFARRAAAQWERWNGPGWQSATDWVTVELANLRTALRWSVERQRLDIATDIAAHAALIGAPGQLFETVTWAEQLIPSATRAEVARLPRLLTGAGYACFSGRPQSAAEHAHTATAIECRAGYDPCEPGLAMFVEALSRVYCGDLERYVELTEHVAGMSGSARAYGLPAYVDGLQASGRIDEAVDLTEESVAAAREVGNPFWIAYALWTAGLAHANLDPQRALAAWNEGVAVVKEHRVEFFEGFLARDAARVLAIDGDPDEALELFGSAIEVFQRASNIAQLIITVALVPAVFERLGRLEPAATLHSAIVREPASVDHVPDLADLGDRLNVAVDQDTLARCVATGSRLDLNQAASYARAEIDVARAELARARSDEPPGGLSRRELEVLHLVVEGLTTREIARRLFISAKTADHHIQHIYTKTGVSNRAAATRWALENGAVATEPPA